MTRRHDAMHGVIRRVNRWTARGKLGLIGGDDQRDIISFLKYSRPTLLNIVAAFQLRVPHVPKVLKYWSWKQEETSLLFAWQCPTKLNYSQSLETDTNPIATASTLKQLAYLL